MKPILVMDHHTRRLEELFTPDAYGRLAAMCEIVGGTNWRLPASTLEQYLPRMRFFVAARPQLTAAHIGAARNLQAIIEVSGTFHPGLDYDACFSRGIEVLSCAPGFRRSVAEMALGLMIAGARGVVAEHEAFRQGNEHWLSDNPATDFTLFDQRIGFIGYGSIARELTRLLAPFSPRIAAYDPWVAAGSTPGIELTTLEAVVSESRCLVVAATPTDQNRQLLSGKLIGTMRKHALVVLISRAHLVDFPALLRAAGDGHIRLATDVFPKEPVRYDDAVRRMPNVILSPHRAAAVEGGRQLIGRMIADDIANMLESRSPERLLRADPKHVPAILGGHQ